ncbi:MAG: CopD family protein [Gemmatimonadota bacterium]|nr:CopD family protein [Gemmatimonadota bacterium]
MTLYYINVTIHILAAFVWVGGMLFLGVVAAPAMKGLDPKVRGEVFTKIGLAFRPVGWTAIAILLTTGVLNLHFGNILSWQLLGSMQFWTSNYGISLTLKIASVITIVVGSLIHDFSLGPHFANLDPNSDEATVLRNRTKVVGRINGVLAIVIILTAIRLARGL